MDIKCLKVFVLYNCCKLTAIQVLCINCIYPFIIILLYYTSYLCKIEDDMHTNNRKDTAVITANSTGLFVSRDLHLHKNGSDDMYVYIQFKLIVEQV